MSHLAPSPPAAGSVTSDPLAGSKYRVLRRIGTGGSGTVYEAEHVELGRRFAVKALLPGYAKDRLSVERMRAEARALGRLQSPHIVEASDFGFTEDGRPFLVMPLLVGRTLREELRQRGCFAPADAIELLQQLLSGLEVAHRAGLVHRDIKLENIFLCDDGATRPVVKLLDFGIAKVLAHAHGAEPPGAQTQDGTVMGTPRFIPPEQAMGREAGPAADLYGAGVVLYELLTGRDPFQHVSGFAPLLKAHVSEAAPAPSAVAPQRIDPVLDEIVMRTLAKRPEDRHASAAELSAALSRALEQVRSAAGCAQAAHPATGASSATPRGASLRVACLIVVTSAVVSALIAATLLRGS